MKGIRQSYSSLHPMLVVLIIMPAMSHPASLDQLGFILRNYQHMLNQLNELFDDFIEDIITPCGYAAVDNPHSFVKGVLSDLSLLNKPLWYLIEKYQEAQRPIDMSFRHLEKLLNRRNNNTMVGLPEHYETLFPEEFNMQMPSERTILQKYYNLSMFAYMLQVTIIEETVRFGDKSELTEEYNRLYSKIMQILCHLQRLLEHEDIIPEVSDIREGLMDEMRKKYSLPPDDHIQQSEEFYRLLVLSESLSNLYIDLDYLQKNKYNVN